MPSLQGHWRSHMSAIERAVISVSDKTGIVPFAEALAWAGVEILASGGTYATLRDADVAVTEVSEVTEFPEIMDGRIKTLHPRIHGGILARRGIDEAAMSAHGIRPIDLVVVNLYPFEQTVARPDCTPELAIENIDIGGPTLLRSAAKNHAHVTVAVDPDDYAKVTKLLPAAPDPALRRNLALKAFRHTSAYDNAIATYLAALGDKP